MNYPIKVLILDTVMDRGGAETMIMNFYRQIDRSKVQFDFVETSFGKATYDDEILSLGGRIFHCPFFNILNYFQIKNWWRNFLDAHAKEYRIVHGHIESSASIYLKLAKKYDLVGRAIKAYFDARFRVIHQENRGMSDARNVPFI